MAMTKNEAIEYICPGDCDGRGEPVLPHPWHIFIQCERCGFSCDKETWIYLQKIRQERDEAIKKCQTLIFDQKKLESHRQLYKNKVEVLETELRLHVEDRDEHVRLCQDAEAAVTLAAMNHGLLIDARNKYQAQRDKAWGLLEKFHAIFARSLKLGEPEPDDETENLWWEMKKIVYEKIDELKKEIETK